MATKLIKVNLHTAIRSVDSQTAADDEKDMIMVEAR